MVVRLGIGLNLKEVERDLAFIVGYDAFFLWYISGFLRIFWNFLLELFKRQGAVSIVMKSYTYLVILLVTLTLISRSSPP